MGNTPSKIKKEPMSKKPDLNIRRPFDTAATFIPKASPNLKPEYYTIINTNLGQFKVYYEHINPVESRVQPLPKIVSTKAVTFNSETYEQMRPVASSSSSNNIHVYEVPRALEKKL